jgi:hypothetical protein
MQTPTHERHRFRQQGAALLIIFTIIVLGAATLLVGGLTKASLQTARGKVSVMALAQAKEALIAFATSVVLTPAGVTRPGDLPCPDLNDDGNAELSCDLQNQRLGRLPWKTLSLPDLRDSSGERLWYAVSNNFKNSTRIIPLNSDTSGGITVRDANGAVILDASKNTGAIAVILSAGQALIRQDGVTQDRSGAAPCIAPILAKAHCNPVNFLDNVTAGEDNADFIDKNTDGYIQGPVKNTSGVTIVNDVNIAITQQDLIPLLEKRVAGETLACLTEYAAAAPNRGHFPWAAALDPMAPPAYRDVTGTRFGRVPDTPFSRTSSDSAAMNTTWPTACNIAVGGWWINWKEMVFYAVASPYQPVSPLTAPSCGACLTVDPPAATTNQHVAVFVAGRRLGGVAAGQMRASDIDKGTIQNYLENQNATPADDIFERNLATQAINDVAVFAP